MPTEAMRADVGRAAARPAVLLIDDDDDARDACQLILEMEGYRIIVAGSAEAALDELRLRPQALCLIVLDLMMPRMNGRDFLTLKATVAALADVPVIVVSASHEPGRGLVTQDVKAVLGKPIRLVELLETVRRWAGPQGSAH